MWTNQTSRTTTAISSILAFSSSSVGCSVVVLCWCLLVVGLSSAVPVPAITDETSAAAAAAAVPRSFFSKRDPKAAAIDDNDEEADRKEGSRIIIIIMTKKYIVVGIYSKANLYITMGA